MKARLRFKDGSYLTRDAGGARVISDVGVRFGWGEGDEPPLPAVLEPPTLLEVPSMNFRADVDGPSQGDFEIPDLTLDDLMDAGFPDPDFEMPNLEIPEMDLDMPLEGMEFPSFGDMLGCGGDGFGDFGDCAPTPGDGSGVGAQDPSGRTPPGGTTNAIGSGPTAGKETFDSDTCFASGTTYLSAIEDISADLGLDETQLTVDGDCPGTFEDDKCFAKGTSKWDALWWVSDQCGMQPIDEGDGGVTIAPVTPLDTTWILNEYTNLFEFTPELDSSELYYAVEAFRPQITQNGTVLAAPIDVMVIVPAPFSADPAEVLRLAVDPGATVSEATALAKSTAAKLGRQSFRITATTFFNPEIKLRHQITIQRPSRDYEDTFMVTSVVHDLSETGKFTTVEAQVILPAPEVL